MFSEGYKTPIGDRGFTLAELMAVVVIMGVLSTLAVVGYRKYLNSARSNEAVHMVGAIRAAEESYRSETLSYLDVSTSLDNYYPTTTPKDQKVQWGGGTSEVARKWRVLNVTTDGAVYFGYSVIAGPPGPVVVKGTPGIPITTTTAVEPWYIIQAKGNVNGDSVFSYCIGTSFNNQLYWKNEGE